MLTVLPEKNQEILSKWTQNSDNTIVLVEKNNDIQLGYMVIKQDESIINIIGFELADCDDYNNLSSSQLADLDLIMRSAGSYALNRNVFYITCTLKKFDQMFLKYGFKETDGILTINLKELFKPCKN